MINRTQSYDVIVDFWQWYRRREANRCNPLESYALDRCEETFKGVSGITLVVGMQSTCVSVPGR